MLCESEELFGFISEYLGLVSHEISNYLDTEQRIFFVV
jgi:hypothetical protein